MADKRGTAAMGPYLLRVQSGKMFLPNDLAHEVKNMYPLEEGTIRSIWGPAAYVPIKKDATGGIVRLFPGTSPHSANPLLETNPNLPVYGSTQHGIFHVNLKNNSRSVLLLHTGAELWEFQGWKRNWRRLLSDPRGSHGLRDELRNDTKARFPTQFESTGNGVVIVPQEGRSYFYDGDTIAPLGFSEIPGTPVSMGPGDSALGTATLTDVSGSNDTDYAHSGLCMQVATQGVSGMTHGFGYCRIGTASTFTNPEAAEGSFGWLESGEWRCKVQFIDKFGNLSAPSNASESVTFTRQGAVIDFFAGIVGAPADLGKVKVSVDALRMQVAWTGVPTGPDHCVGRIIYRTKDLVNSGDIKFYELPLNAASVATGFATLPDNVTTVYPDNIPDSFLALPIQEFVPIPKFKLCQIAFGRLWIGNIEGSEGMIRPSMPGQWGTFKKNEELYPDPAGGEITGMRRCDRGMLVFTRNSSFLVQASDDGTSFRQAPLSQEVGCVAPNSVRSLSNGLTVWLSTDGFYSFDGTTISFISPQLKKFFRRVTKSRYAQACAAYDPQTQEYRCWVSTNGSVENDTCFIFDGSGWRTRTDVKARDVCTTRDHRNYMLVAGEVTDHDNHGGVWLLDHAGNRSDVVLQLEIDKREAQIETVWLDGQASMSKKTVPVAYLWFRETEKSDLTIEVMRDWSEKVVETVSPKRYSTKDAPPFWGEAKLDAADTSFKERKPYWTRAQIYLPSAETFKFRIKGSGFWEFVGLSFDESPRYFGGAQLPG